VEYLAEYLNRLVKLQKDFTSLYDFDDGMYAITTTGVQVAENFLTLIPGELTVEIQDGQRYPYRGSKIYDGVEFFAVSAKPFEQGGGSDD